jgi:hypothetical protein
MRRRIHGGDEENKMQQTRQNLLLPLRH